MKGNTFFSVNLSDILPVWLSPGFISTRKTLNSTMAAPSLSNDSPSIMVPSCFDAPGTFILNKPLVNKATG